MHLSFEHTYGVEKRLFTDHFCTGIIHQARLPPDHVLLLLILDDR